MRQRP